MPKQHHTKEFITAVVADWIDLTSRKHTCSITGKTTKLFTQKEVIEIINEQEGKVSLKTVKKWVIKATEDKIKMEQKAELNKYELFWIEHEKQECEAHAFFAGRNCVSCRPCFDKGLDECRACGFDLHSWDTAEEEENDEEGWKVEEDDCGVLCLYDPRTEGWETLYDTCVECGAVWDECDCEDAPECKATATREQILRATKLGLL